MLIQWKCSRCWVAGCLLAFIQVARALDLGALPAAQTAVYVADLHTRQVVVEHRAGVAMSPASAMKLLTAFTALQKLGEDYQWRTEWRSDAAVADGHLRGNLYWVGSGDPVFDQKDLQAMQAQLRLRGINHIDGEVVLDRTVWNRIAGADDFGEDAGEVFVTAPDPHMVAYKVLWATAQAGDGGAPEFVLDPPLAHLPVRNRTQWQPGTAACSSLARFVRADYRGGVLSFSGSLPRNCVGKQMYVNLLDAPVFAQRSFQAYWRLGGTQQMLRFGEGAVPATTAVLAVHDSKPLKAVVADMNKYSNNVIARTLFLTLGQQSGLQSDTVAAAENVTRQVLSATGIQTTALRLENGSGLSRTERVSARLLGQVLVQAYQAPFASAFRDSLPVGGVDGTLKNRFRGTQGQWHLKTGTLDNVRALAGYWLPENPQQHALAVVVLVNAPDAAVYLTALDDWLAQLPQRLATQQHG